MINCVFILAAGRGERLKPLTHNQPKALCLMHGKPLIQYHVEHLAQAGVERIVINHAYLGDQIKRYLGDGSRFNVEIIYSPDPPGGLESLGGICAALKHIDSPWIVTLNADIYTSFNFKAFLSQTFSEKHGHLVLVPMQPSHPKPDFGLSNTHYISEDNKQYIFSGIACYPTKFFKNMAIQRASITPWLRTWACTQKLKGSIFHDLWFDIGTIERLKQAQGACNVPPKQG